VFNPHTKLEVCTITCYKDIKAMQNVEIVVFRVVKGHSRSSAMSPFDRAHTTLIGTMYLSSVL